MFRRDRARITFVPAGYAADINRLPPRQGGGCGRIIGLSAAGLLVVAVLIGVVVLALSGGEADEPMPTAYVIYAEVTDEPTRQPGDAPTAIPEQTDEPTAIAELTDEPRAATPTMIPRDGVTADLVFDATTVYEAIIAGTATANAMLPISPYPPTAGPTALPVERVITSPPIVIVHTVQPPPVVIVHTQVIVQTSQPVIITATTRPTLTPLPEVTDEPTAQPTNTATLVPTATVPPPSATYTATATHTLTPTHTPTWTPLPSSTLFPTWTPTATATLAPPTEEPTDESV